MLALQRLLREREREVPKFFFNIESWGEHDSTIIVENSRHRIVKDAQHTGYLFLNGMDIMNFTLDEVPNHIRMLCKFAHCSVDDISLFACHQANKLILNSLAASLSIESSKMPFVATETGNTSSASIPLLLSQEYAAYGKKRELVKTCCCGFGVGLSAGGVLLDLSQTQIHPVVTL